MIRQSFYGNSNYIDECMVNLFSCYYSYIMLTSLLSIRSVPIPTDTFSSAREDTEESAEPLRQLRCSWMF